MVNKATLIGRLGKDPETRDINGTTLASFSLATSKTWKKDGEKQEKTEWHNIKAWGRLAEVISQYLNKGDLVFIEGEIEYRTYEVEGVTKQATDIRATNMTMLSTRGDKQGQKSSAPDKVPASNLNQDDDDLPF